MAADNTAMFLTHILRGENDTVTAFFFCVFLMLAATAFCFALNSAHMNWASSMPRMAVKATRFTCRRTIILQGIPEPIQPEPPAALSAADTRCNMNRFQDSELGIETIIHGFLNFR